MKPANVNINVRYKPKIYNMRNHYEIERDIIGKWLQIQHLWLITNLIKICSEIIKDYVKVK